MDSRVDTSSEDQETSIDTTPSGVSKHSHRMAATAPMVVTAINEKVAIAAAINRSDENAAAIHTTAAAAVPHQAKGPDHSPASSAAAAGASEWRA